MTYKEFVETFVKTEKTFMAYRQGRYLVRVVKIPLAKGVHALYASCTYCPGPVVDSPDSGFEERMMLAGFSDSKKNLRFPSYEFINTMVDDGEDIVEEKRDVVLGSAILTEVDKLAMAKPLPPCPDESCAYERAYSDLFFEEQMRFPMSPYGMFDRYFNDSILVDYLADTPGWAEAIAEKWANGFAKRQNGRDLTALDIYREGLAEEKRVKEFIDAIKADKNHKLHRYIAMKKAVKSKDGKTVTVEFRTASGGIDSVKVRASVFYTGNRYRIEHIPLYEIAPRHESDRVAGLLPKEISQDGREYPANAISKDDIVAIKYGRNTIWGVEEESK